jgi:hypothetical protein
MRRRVRRDQFPWPVADQGGPVPDGERFAQPEPTSAAANRMREATERLRITRGAEREQFDKALAVWNAAGRPPWR